MSRKGSDNARYTNNLKRKSLHRLDSTRKSHSDNTNFSSLFHHTYHEHDFLYPSTSEVCKIKSNSIPRSAVERKQRRKRTKMCRKMENKLENSNSTPMSSEKLLNQLPSTKSTSEKPASSNSLPLNTFVSKTKSDQVVYL